MLAHGEQFDVIGESFHPFWHGPSSALTANLNDLATRYGKPIVVAETAYPFQGNVLPSIRTAFRR